MNSFVSKNINTALSLLGVVVVLGGIYWYFFEGPSTSTTPLTETSGTAAGGQIFVLASQLDTVSFDTSIFSDPRFASLQDISTPVTPEPEGRTDPFAPASP